jgi:hypothetical protein
VGEASDIVTAESTPGMAPNDTLYQDGNLYFDEHDDGGAYLPLVVPDPRVLSADKSAARNRWRVV